MSVRKARFPVAEHFLPDATLWEMNRGRREAGFFPAYFVGLFGESYVAPLPGDSDFYPPLRQPSEAAEAESCALAGRALHALASGDSEEARRLASAAQRALSGHA